MKSKCYIMIVCVVCGLMFSLVAKADEYQIRYLNSKNIVIGNKKAVKYMRFSDKNSIVWPMNEKNVYMRLWNITQHREEYRPPREKKRSTGPGEIDLSTKGTIDPDTIPMLDSLNFAIGSTDYNVIKFEARWVEDNYIEKSIILPRSNGGRCVSIVREMFNFPEEKVADVEIYALKPDDDFVLWKLVTVRIVPLMLYE